MGIDGVLHCKIKHFFFVSRGSKLAWNVSWEPTTIHNLATCGHEAPPTVGVGTSLASYRSEFQHWQVDFDATRRLRVAGNAELLDGVHHNAMFQL